MYGTGASGRWAVYSRWSSEIFLNRAKNTSDPEPYGPVQTLRSMLA